MLCTQRMGVEGLGTLAVASTGAEPINEAQMLMERNEMSCSITHEFYDVSAAACGPHGLRLRMLYGGAQLQYTSSSVCSVHTIAIKTKGLKMSCSNNVNLLCSVDVRTTCGTASATSTVAPLCPPSAIHSAHAIINQVEYCFWKLLINQASAELRMNSISTDVSSA